MTKPICLFEILVDAIGIYFNPKAGLYVKLLFENANSGYAEVSVRHIEIWMAFPTLSPDPTSRLPWSLCPTLQSMATLEAFNRKFFGGLQHRERPTADSASFASYIYSLWAYLHFRTAPYMSFISDIFVKLPQWREERLPPPRVNQSEVPILLTRSLSGLTANRLSTIKLVWLVNEANTPVLPVLTVLSVLQWIWVSAHVPTACLVFPYAVAMMWVFLQSETSDLLSFTGLRFFACRSWTIAPNYKPLVQVSCTFYQRFLFQWNMLKPFWKISLLPSNHQ